MSDVEAGARRALAASMALGAAYDLAFGVAMLFAPASAAQVLRIALPADALYVRFSGLLLLVLGALYVLPACDPSHYRAVVRVAVAARVAGFVFLTAAWRSGRETAFLALALADLAFAALHGWLLARARVSSS